MTAPRYRLEEPGYANASFRWITCDRKSAEVCFVHYWSIPDGRAAMTEYEAQARAIREKTARLKALRLAKEAKTVIAL
jgi:hypothetical protein